jgi:hypothetical protein
MGGNASAAGQEAGACDTLTFVKAPAYPAGPRSIAIAKGDFNNDGRIDVVVLNQQVQGVTQTSKLSVLLGTGVGGFEAPRTVDLGGPPSAVAVGDFNNDGRLDAAAIVFQQLNNVKVFLGDGAGNLRPPAVFTAGAFPAAIAVGDFNGDGKADLAVANDGLVGSNYVSILLGSGDGRFGAAAETPRPGTPLNSVARVVVVDLNGDGRQDLVVEGASMWRIMGNGDGTFAAPVMFDASLTLGSVVVGDFNRDGRQDLAGTRYNGVFVVTCLPGDGAGGFGAPIDSSPRRGGATRLTVADFDGDGSPDLGTVIATRYVNVLLGDGAGAFTPGPNYDAGPPPDDLVDLVAADLDGDGRQDIAALNTDLETNAGRVTVLIGTGEGSFAGARSFSIPGAASFNGAAVAADDFNGDGKLDLLNFDDAAVSLLAGSAPGEFGEYVGVAGSLDHILPFGQILPFGPRPVFISDFNRDGKPDFAVRTFESINGSTLMHIRVLTNDGSGAFTEASDTRIEGILDVRFRDTSRDGNPDNVLFRDMNGDGNPDIVLLEPAGDLVIRLGDGRGGFGTSSVILPRFNPNLFYVEAGDFNGDGKADLALTDTGPSGGRTRLSILFGDGRGGFSAPTSVPSDAFFLTTLAQDFNGDGRSDLVTIINPSGKSRVLLADAAGGFTPGPAFDTGTAAGRLFSADLNGDAKPDLVVSNNASSPTPSTVTVLTGDGAGGFSAPVPLVTLPGPASVAFADFDRNGRTDIVLVGRFDDSIRLYFNACPGMPFAPTHVQFGASAFSAAEGDGAATVTVTRTGDASGGATVRYSTLDGTASARSDYTAVAGLLRFAPGETSKTFRVLLTDDALAEGAESLTLALSDAAGAALGPPSRVSLALTDNDAAPGGANPAADPRFFVQQHYHDFLNREPDPQGWDFWTGQITNCGNPDLEFCRVNVSAAFFLSIEFQETGYLAYRFYKVAYGDATSPNVPGTVPMLRLRDFLPDTQQLGRGMQVNVGDWQQRLESNKQAYALEFVRRERFLKAFPPALGGAEFIDRLNRNAGGVLTQGERDLLVAQLSSASDQTAGRAAVLRVVAESRALRDAEFNRAFVLMQYFGYLRRNPDDAPELGLNYGGWRFWLSKLNGFGGDYVRAEMVKAFLDSAEYRRRFSQ